MSTDLTIKEDIIQEQILQAAKELFAVYGFAKVTMEDVAKAIGKGRSSLYYYYKSKDELLDAVITVGLSEVRTGMEKGVNQATTVEDKIKAFYLSKLNMVPGRKSFFETLESGMDADAISKFKKVKSGYHENTLEWESNLLTKVLKEGIKKGELKELSKKEMEFLVFALVRTLHGLKWEIRVTSNMQDVEKAVVQLTHALLNGLRK